MDNEINSFRQYLRSTILPQLGTCNLYSNIIGVTPVFPAIFVRLLKEQISVVQQAREAIIQIDVVSDNNDERAALVIARKLLTALGLRKTHAIMSCTLYDYSDPDNPVDTGFKIAWYSETEVRKISGVRDNSGNTTSDYTDPDLVRFVFELKIIYSL